ncbi:uncharacterized protein LOC143063282 [Mytilus galloprovincialis]|uniref:uncharacterized protein LOC143063282 n=1 Tax=Mytilus galloprovincialis TaxID=29158 RepID=UPI003F7BCD3C
MDVDYLLVLCVVCLSFGFSTNRYIHGFFPQPVKLPLQCFENKCVHNFPLGIFGKKRQYGSHFYCQIGHQDGLFTGHCGENFFHDKKCGLYNREPTCKCYDQSCINWFVERNRQHQALNQVAYSCLKETCHGTEHCHIQEKDGKIVSTCKHYEPTSQEMCWNHNYVTLPNGCYCNNVECVKNIEVPTTNTPSTTTVPALPTDYTHEHITVPTLDPEYLCDKASCRSDMFCQLITYQGVATSRCLVIHIGKQCVSYKDVDETGCICNNANCATRFLTEYSIKHPATTTTSTKPPTPSTPSTTTSTMKTPTTPAITTSPTTPPTTKTPTTPPTSTSTTTTPTKTPTTTNPTIIPTTPLTTPPTTTTPSTTTPTSTTPSTTTPSTTTPTTTTPTTTTLTTTFKTMPTTSTITPTTTPTTTTTTTGPRTCHICGDTSLPVPCSSRQIGRDLSHTCKTGENYCMTDIVHDDQGNVDVFKRCVDLATCEKKWITESADLDYCKRYGVVRNPYAFSCHFCCTEDKCNSMLVPNTTTWYTKIN